MNFLGHAYLARKNPTLIGGNFAGDFFKGNLKNFNLNPEIMHGVELHRKIDSYTDANENIKKAGKILQAFGVNKIAFIATDILVDHYLSSNWNLFHDQEYEEFLSYVYHHTDAQLSLLPDEFSWLYNRLKKQKWMHQYNSLDGIQEIMRQFSHRIPFENDLQKSFIIYRDEAYDEMNQYFHQFIIDIDVEIQQFILEMKAAGE